ncbi:VOC family protein [Glycomyces xiaoerkulensis]|uniref:VOC family protein n=1 Tax=Glycomyces xiaoerkulensis TaxID=2038139 RepID=UPI000C25EB02|nr:VOC family protein [Glycomyces xiaoerkulensis]
MGVENTITAFLEADGLQDWRLVGEGACAHYRTGSLAAGIRFAEAVARLDGADRHPPAIDLRADGATVRLVTITEDHYGPGETDLALAEAISAVARDQGLEAEPEGIQTIQVSIDALDRAEVMPFWRAVLGYEPRADSPDEDLIDPRGRGAFFWFQQMDRPRPQRNRIHVDVWVPHDRAEARIEAALAAGGRMLSREFAPSWWVLADPEGNEACVCTALGRG